MMKLKLPPRSREIRKKYRRSRYLARASENKEKLLTWLWSRLLRELNRAKAKAYSLATITWANKHQTMPPIRVNENREFKWFNRRERRRLAKGIKINAL